MDNQVPITTFVQHILSNNDRNGNPRRCFMVYGEYTGALIGVYDEGYLGEHAIPEYIRNGIMVRLPRIYVPPTEYKRLLRLAPKY